MKDIYLYSRTPSMSNTPNIISIIPNYITLGGLDIEDALNLYIFSKI